MPQMAPLSWLFLFLFFTVLFLITNAMMNFSFINPVKTSKTEFKYNSTNWKW